MSYQQEQTEERGPDKVMETIDRSFGDKTEELRIVIGSFKGNDFIGLRVFWKTPEGTFAPGKSGVSVKKKELVRVIAALEKIRNELGL